MHVPSDRTKAARRREQLRISAWVGFVVALTIVVADVLLIALDLPRPLWLKLVLTCLFGGFMAPAICYFITKDDRKAPPPA